MRTAVRVWMTLVRLGLALREKKKLVLCPSFTEKSIGQIFCLCFFVCGGHVMFVNIEKAQHRLKTWQKWTKHLPPYLSLWVAAWSLNSSWLLFSALTGFGHFLSETQRKNIAKCHQSVPLFAGDLIWVFTRLMLNHNWERFHLDDSLMLCSAHIKSESSQRIVKYLQHSNIPTKNSHAHLLF